MSRCWWCDGYQDELVDNCGCARDDDRDDVLLDEHGRDMTPGYDLGHYTRTYF